MRKYLPGRLQWQKEELLNSDQNIKDSQKDVGMGMCELFITIQSGELN